MDTQQRNQFIGLGILAVVFAVVIWFTYFRVDPAAQYAEEDPSGVVENVIIVREPQFKTTEVDIESLVKDIEEVQFRYDDVRVPRNPMTPLVGRTQEIDRGPGVNGPTTKKIPKEELLYEANRKDLTGIVWDSVKPLAVLDDEVVYEGYEFEEGIVVRKIGPTYVELYLELDGEDLIITKELKEQ